MEEIGPLVEKLLTIVRISFQIGILCSEIKGGEEKLSNIKMLGMGIRNI